jgi:hypothetical protein
MNSVALSSSEKVFVIEEAALDKESTWKIILIFEGNKVSFTYHDEAGHTIVETRGKLQE